MLSWINQVARCSYWEVCGQCQYTSPWSTIMRALVLLYPTIIGCPFSLGERYLYHPLVRYHPEHKRFAVQIQHESCIICMTCTFNRHTFTWVVCSTECHNWSPVSNIKQYYLVEVILMFTQVYPLKYVKHECHAVFVEIHSFNHSFHFRSDSSLQLDSTIKWGKKYKPVLYW